ncbi:phosphoribosylanthranilate isomerase [Thermanaerothrix sp. 4228-RoL]|uniref:N-(5'-phosphoribosyl)anthranilate isomerase n=1 Tax=Thermanaerothrix solaris TaxID=3058434 RepID=A0ABU3NSJ2_9CHLR|nr:phosphoribosylanthranilate isomerase [Thermanaerothrix sp. 4228-RoL]MDT8899365.1 phosphoribosylanthranilate isomerase [Thermanaerothrix sp. 4228-RoL]
MIIQIYAFTRLADALATVELGVDHIGFVAGRYGIVHGELDFKEARALVEGLPTHATSVALTMATEVDEILRMVQEVRPHVVHISTDPLDVDETAMKILKHHLPEGVRLMKAIPVAGEESLELARRFSPYCDFILLDTKVTGLPGVGATGMTHNWRLSRQIVETVNVPVILAGGLSPENVAEAIRQVRPYGVDSNTHTNRPGSPVEKDLQRIAAFVQAVRQAEWEGKD